MAFDEELRKAQAALDQGAKTRQASDSAKEQWAATLKRVAAQAFKALVDGGAEQILFKASDRFHGLSKDVIVVYLTTWEPADRLEAVYVDTQGNLYESGGSFMRRRKKLGEKHEFLYGRDKMVYKRENGRRLMNGELFDDSAISRFPGINYNAGNIEAYMAGCVVSSLRDRK